MLLPLRLGPNSSSARCGVLDRSSIGLAASSSAGSWSPMISFAHLSNVGQVAAGSYSIGNWTADNQPGSCSSSFPVRRSTMPLATFSIGSSMCSGSRLP